MFWMHAIFSESASEWVQARSSTLQHKAAGIRGITIIDVSRIVWSDLSGPSAENDTRVWSVNYAIICDVYTEIRLRCLLRDLLP